MDDDMNERSADRQPVLAGLDVPGFAGSKQEAFAEAVRRAEAILFAAGQPLAAGEVAQVLPQGIEAAEVLMALREMYLRRGVNLVEVAGKWRFQTAQDLAWMFVEERQVQKRLSQAVMETLAIIAYGQPVTRAEIEAVRGVSVSRAVIDTLMETGWIRTMGRRRTPGLPVTYGTTAAFLEHFGLESLDTLPGKADLDAEGLISQQLPDGFAMPDETLGLEGEAATEEEAGSGDHFMTDFVMGEHEGMDGPDLPEENGPVAGVDEGKPDTETDGEPEISVFSYTSAEAAERVPDEAHIRAAVMRMRRERRAAEQRMESGADEA